MKVLLNILGGILLFIGIGWGVYIVVAVATQAEGFTTITGAIPALVFHLVVNLLGMVCLGLGLRKKQQTA